MTVKSIFTAPIRYYQKHISPTKPACCKYRPTCSSYAIEAIEEWGVIRGLALAIWRVLRCNPFSKGGFDPVPDNPKKKRATEEVALSQACDTHEKSAPECDLPERENVSEK